jgi:predicted ribosomally synthesized peptide with SipW-like signal peptide
MTDDTFDLSRRKALAALGTIGVASAGAGLGTSAYFSDQETFENNQLTAGTLDMKVAWSEHYSDWAGGEAAFARMPESGEEPTFRLPPGSGQSDARPIELLVEDGQGFLGATREERENGGLYPGTGEFADLCGTDADAPDRPLIDLDDVKPGDFGFGLFRFQLCTNPGKLWLTGGLTAANENDVTEPERDDPDEYGDAGATNPALVELLDEIQVAFGVGTTNDLAAADPGANLFPDPEAVSGVPQPATQYSLREFLTLAEKGIPLNGDIDAAAGGGTGRNCFSGETEQYVSVVWWLPIDHGNEVQSDSVTFDLGFYTEQCRHNATADWFVDGDETGDFAAIQAAIDAAEPGDVIEVDSGTYAAPDEGIAVDTDGLTLRSVGSRATIEGTGIGTNPAVSIEADDVTFEGFEVTNPGGLLGISIGNGSTGRGFSGVTIRCNRVHDVGPKGRLGVTGIIGQFGETHENLTIENNLVEDLRNEIAENTFGFPTVNGIFVDDPNDDGEFGLLRDSTIADNVVRNLESDIAPVGIILNTEADGVEIRGNYVTDLLASQAVDSDDTDDSIEEFGFTYAQGINHGGPTSGDGVAIVENTVTDITSRPPTDAGEFVGEAVKIDGDASGVTLDRNNLLAPIGVTNADGSTLDATCNWWGSSAGPEEASANPPSTSDDQRRDVLGAVDFDPWLIESYDADADVPSICTGN